MSKVKYCAVGEEGIEGAFDTKSECEKWMKDTIEENEMPEDYYYVDTFTQKELDEMPEV